MVTTGGGGGWGGPPTSDVQREAGTRAGGGVVSCIKDNGHMGTQTLSNLLLLGYINWRTDKYENITFPQLRWQVV